MVKNKFSSERVNASFVDRSRKVPAVLCAHNLVNLCKDSVPVDASCFN